MEDVIELEAATYWRLRFLAADAELSAVQARMTSLDARHRLDQALAQAHVPASGAWAWDDATHTLRRTTDAAVRRP